MHRSTVTITYSTSKQLKGDPHHISSLVACCYNCQGPRRTQATRWLRCRNLLTRSLVPPIYRTTDRAPTQQRMRGQHAAQLPNGRCSRLRRLRVLPARLSVLGARPSTSLCALGLCRDPLSPGPFLLSVTGEFHPALLSSTLPPVSYLSYRGS